MGLEDRFAASDSVGEGPFIPGHQFEDLMMEYVRGKVTAGEALTAINLWLVDNKGAAHDLTASETADLNAIRGLIDAESTLVGKMLKAMEIGDCLSLMEYETSGYETRSEVKAKMGF